MTLSFLIPCYNVERYVALCLDSIFAVETFRLGYIGHTDNDFEVVCVNDCSTDSTSLILHSYEKSHPNLKIVDLPHNIGWGGVRNIAMQQAVGQFIWFVDSDDTIVSGQLVRIVDNVVSEDLDILAFNFNNLDADGSLLKTYTVFNNSDIMSGKTFVRKYFAHNFGANIGFVWRFIYKSVFIKRHNILFPEGRCWEDSLFVPQTILLAERMKSIEAVAYNYWRHYSSAVMTFSKLKPARMIYWFCIDAGRDILQLSHQIDDPDISKMLYDIAVDGYFNQIALLLCQTNRRERKVFYDIVQEEKHRAEIKEVLPYMGILQKFLLTPYLQRPLAELTAFCYHIKHLDRLFKNHSMVSKQNSGRNMSNVTIIARENVKLSIIVPIYNAGQNLEECLNSIANQTYKDFQCILVNDGSTDNSQTIIDAFCNNDSRFVSLVKPNEKSADLARKYAIDRIDTEWLMHVDADDVIVPDFVERMIRRQLETDADVVCARLVGCKKGIEGMDYTVPVSTFDMSQLMKGPDAFLQTIGGWGMSANAGVLYRRRLTEAIPYKGYINSDEFSQRLLLYYADRVAFEDVQYLYRANDGISVTFSTRIFSRTQTDKDILEFVDYHFPYNSEKRTKIRRQYYRNLVYLVYDFLTHHQQLQPTDKYSVSHILHESHTYLRRDLCANKQFAPPLFALREASVPAIQNLHLLVRKTAA